MTRADDTNDVEPRHRRGTNASRLGRYVVLGTLARGGMGEVLRARALGAAGATKEVCLKRIRATSLGDRHAVERFVHEARLALSMTHANIVSTFDFGRAGADYYLAMEWIDGADLSRIARAAADDPLSPAVVAHVGAEIARALRYAHEGAADGSRPAVAHCDVKPSNVLVSRAGDVKLADFGVAVAHLEGSRGGTPRYMAPEQRDHDAAGPGVDAYALGVVLRELLTLTRDPPRELEELARALSSEDPAARPTAHEAYAALEDAVAHARRAGEPSPRDELGRRAALSAPTIDATSAELEPDASCLRDGESETATRLTGTTGSAPELATAVSSPKPTFPWAALAVVLAVGAGAALAVSTAAPARLPVTTTTAVGTAGLASEPGPAAARAGAPASGPEPASDPEPASGPELVREPEPARDRGARAEVVAAPRRAAAAATVGATPRSRPPERPSADAIDREPAPVAAPAPAHLRVNALPWANVELDGRELGPTPLTHLEVEPGPHTLRFTNPVLGISRVEHLTVAADERRDVIVELRPGGDAPP